MGGNFFLPEGMVCLYLAFFLFIFFPLLPSLCASETGPLAFGDFIFGSVVLHIEAAFRLYL